MLVTAKFSDLPHMYTGIKFSFVGVPQEEGRVYQTVNDAIFPNALVDGHSIIMTEAGDEASLLDANSEIAVDVYAEPYGIFVGGLCVALGNDVSDPDHRWHYWQYSARELFEQVKKLYS